MAEDDPAEMELTGAAAVHAGGRDGRDFTRCVDVRNLMKLPDFSGTQEDWVEFRFRFESVMSLLELEKPMAVALGCEDAALANEVLPDAQQQQARLLFGALIQCCSGRALAVARLCPPGHGFLAWQRIVREYEPETVGRHVAMLVGILSPDWRAKTEESFVDALLTWERAVNRYETSAGLQLQSGVKCAIVARYAPVVIKNWLRTVSTEVMASYPALRSALQTYLSRGRAYTAAGASQEPVPMDVSTVQQPRYQRRQWRPWVQRFGQAWRAQVGQTGAGGRPGAGGGGQQQQQQPPRPQWPQQRPQTQKGQYKGAGKGGSPWPRPGQQQQQQPGKPLQGGGGTGAFAGYCHRCGKKGHKKADCKAQVMEVSEQAPSTAAPSTSASSLTMGGGTERPLVGVLANPMTDFMILMLTHGGLPVGQAASSGVMYLLVDSGAYDHVCPPTFGDEYPLIAPKINVKAVTADGHIIKYYGERQIPLKLVGDRHALVTFSVMAITRPILSVSRLIEHEFQCCFARQAFLCRHEERFALVKNGGLYYLPACVREVDTLGPPFPELPELKKLQARAEVCAVVGMHWSIFEWCCDPESSLSQWFADHRQEVLRLCLPDWDLEQSSVVRIAGQRIRAALIRQREVLVWISLPCGCWSSWQRINRRNSRLRAQNDRARERSRGMVGLVASVLVPLRREFGSQLVLAVEWPRMCEGWKCEEMVDLRQILPYVSHFHGCAFGLTDTAGRPILKPWTVMCTDDVFKEPLGHAICGGEHVHGVCNGLTAKRSAYYPPAMIEALGQALLERSRARVVAPIDLEIQEDVDSGLERAASDVREAEGGAVASQGLIPPATAAIPDGSDNDELNAEEVQPDPVVQGPALELPPAEVQQAHDLVHLPYQPWCQLCVQGKGRDQPHRRIADDAEAADQPTVVQIDYGYIGSLADRRPSPILIAMTSRLAAGFACVARRKGRSDPYPVSAFLHWLDEIGLHSSIRLRSDGEPSLIAVCREIAVRRAGGPDARTLLETTPVGSHGSNGAVDQWALTLAGQCRTLKLQVERDWRVQVANASEIFPWLVRHAAWLHLRYQAQRGETGFHRIFGHEYHHPIFRFAAPVLARSPEALDQPKLEARWLPGIWLGKDSRSDAHIVGCEVGVVLSRSARPMLQGPDRDQAYMKMRWTPWNLRGQKTVPLEPEESEEQVPVRSEGTMGAPPTGSQGPFQPQVTRGFDEFAIGCGPTPGCAGCKNPASRKHIAQCWERRRNWERLQLQDEPLDQALTAPTHEEVIEELPQQRPLPSADLDLSAELLDDRKRRQFQSLASKVVWQSHSRLDAQPVAESLAKRAHRATLADWLALKRLGKVLVGESEWKDLVKQTAKEIVPEAQQETSGLTSMPAVPVPPEDEEMVEHGQKRERDALMEEEIAREEQEARVGSRDVTSQWADDIAMVARADQVEGPWFDDVTGQRLDDDAVARGMESERQSLMKFGFGDPSTREQAQEEGAEVVSSRWVLRHKPSADDPEKVKARLVAQQINRGDQRDAFCATPSTSSARLLLCIAIREIWKVHILDISTAFLHAELPAETRIHILPPGTDRVAPGTKGETYRLKRALYGLRESPRIFQEHLAQRLASFGIKRLRSDAQVFVSLTGLILVIHMDDLLFTGPAEQLDLFLEILSQEFMVKPVVEIGSDWVRFLGKEFRRRRDGSFDIRIPPQYYSDLLDVFGMSGAKSVGTPIVQGAIRHEVGAPLCAADSQRYRTCVGKLIWVLPERPDIAYSVKECASSVKSPHDQQLLLLKRILRYLKGTMSAILHLPVFQGAEDIVDVLADASWATGEHRRSTSGGLVRWRGATITCWSRTQSTIAQSTCEAELVALSTGAVEGRYIQHVLQELSQTAALQLSSDSQSTLNHTLRRGVGRIKHLELRYLWLQDELRAGRLQLKHIGSVVNPADLLTKAMTKGRMEYLLKAFEFEFETEPEEHGFIGMIGWLFSTRRSASSQQQHEELEEATPEALETPRCCGQAMQLLVDGLGLVRWQCTHSERHRRSWPEFLSARGIDRRGSMICLDLAASHSAGAVHIHGDVGQAYVQAGPVRPALSSGATAGQPSEQSEQPQSQRAARGRGRGVQRGRGRGEPVPRGVLDPPTHRQINYIAAICYRKGWNWELVVADLRSKAEASAWIDTHK